MREIKFRAWDKKLKKFIDFAEQNISLHPENGSLFTNSLGEFDVTKNFELMQYTGLKDKNGKEIYEGDIVVKRLITPKILTVGTFKPFEVKWMSYGYNLSFMGKHTCEIIGNICENMEVLE